MKKECPRCANGSIRILRDVRARIKKNKLTTTVRLDGDPFVMMSVDVPTRKYKEIVYCKNCSNVIRTKDPVV